MTDSSFSSTSNNEDLSDIDLILKAVEYDQSLEAGSSRTRNWINRERDIDEERLMADYFGANGDPPKYPDYYFRRRYPGANNDFIVLNHSLLFNAILTDTAPIAPFVVNGVGFDKGYYLADGVYPQWATFVKSFTVARDGKNALFKRRQEGAENRPPMLERSQYDSWQSRMLLYIRGKEHDIQLLDSVKNGPFQFGTVEVSPTPNTPASTRERTFADLIPEEKIREAYDIRAPNIILQVYHQMFTLL
ncbi:ALP1-like protein [Tanacetum coccineum]